MQAGNRRGSIKGLYIPGVGETMRWQTLMGRKRATKWSGMGKDYMNVMASQYREANLKNQTPEERKFQDFLKVMKISYFPQKIFFFKKKFFIVDFFFPQYGFAVEIDGAGHFTRNSWRYDKLRTSHIRCKYGVRFIRFSNYEVMKKMDRVELIFKREIESFIAKNKPKIKKEIVKIEDNVDQATIEFRKRFPPGYF